MKIAVIASIVAVFLIFCASAFVAGTFDFLSLNPMARFLIVLTSAYCAIIAFMAAVEIQS